MRKREGGDLLFLVPNEAQTPDATAIGEDDMLATLVQLPASCFVLN